MGKCYCIRYGGGGKLSLWYTNNNYILVLSKTFHINFLNELRVRENTSVNNPRIIMKDEHGRWYVEEKVDGFTLPQKSFGHIHLLAFYELFKLYEENKTKKVKFNWLIDNIKEKLKMINIDKHEIFNLLNNMELNKYLVTIVHGDFIDSNIIYNAKYNKYTILDWEYTGYKSICHDIFNYFTIKTFITGKNYNNMFLNGKNDYLNELKFKFLNIFNIDHDELRLYELIYYLERINLEIIKYKCGILKSKIKLRGNCLTWVNLLWNTLKSLEKY